MQINAEKKQKEKDTIKNDVKVLSMMSEDFDPELYIKHKEDEEDVEEKEIDDE
jgi:hypothetical protein